ncbi:hypothetical protein HPP92_027658 [Vanilla planifolia]|uniref:Uncharacterized protein n=1 Tax=Vanilla planifolia TaxID=51239 RepID=A0A835PE79_VANPL|nr:hypothetical protein HPP92_027658 [Vanilla planifolia]
MFNRFFLHNRQVVSSYSAGPKLSFLRDASWSYNLLSQSGISTSSLENASGKAYATFAIFKGKAALMISPLPAQFTKMDSGSVRVHRKGVVMLKFIPAIGQRKYDSEKKQFISIQMLKTC